MITHLLAPVLAWLNRATCTIGAHRWQYVATPAGPVKACVRCKEVSPP